MILGLTVYAIVLLLLGAASILLLVIVVQLAINTFSFSRGEGLDSRTTDARAEELLRTILDESEWLQLKTLRFLDVASMHYRQRFYRIPLMDGMVNVFEDGKAIQRLCIQPINVLPRYDVIAMHKLMIEGDEMEYLARANAFPPKG